MPIEPCPTPDASHFQKLAHYRDQIDDAAERDAFDYLTSRGTSAVVAAATIEWIRTPRGYTKQDCADRFGISRPAIQQADSRLRDADIDYPDSSRLTIPELISEIATELGWEPNDEYAIDWTAPKQHRLTKKGWLDLHDTIVENSDSDSDSEREHGRDTP